MRPFPPIIHQPGANWILQDIFRRFVQFFVSAQSMIKEITLPFDAEMPSRPMLPSPYRRSHFLGKRSQQMQMIGHDHRKRSPPFALIVIEPDGLKQSLRRIFLKQWITRSIPRAKRQKVGFPGGIAHPMRRLVGQLLSANLIHTLKATNFRTRKQDKGRDGSPLPSVALIAVGTRVPSRPTSLAT